MRMKIYQISPFKHEFEDIVQSLKELERVDPSIYEKVFDAEVDMKYPMQAYERMKEFNPHPLFSGLPFKYSDVVVTDDGAYFFEKGMGFQKIDFDERQVNTDNLIRVLFVQPHEKPYVAEIPNTLKAKQHAVGGYVEFVYNRDGTALVGNEEAKLEGLEGNRYLDGGGIIAGNFLVLGVAESDCRSLTDEEVERYMEKYKEAPDISPEETAADCGFIFAQF